MLLWSRAGRWAACLVVVVLIAWLFGLPMLTLLLASVAGSWNGVLPDRLVLANFQSAPFTQGPALVASVTTALVATLIALVVGGWFALVARRLDRRVARWLDVLLMLPVAVPSVVIGLSLLVAFSEPPLVLDGTALIVMLAHAIIVTPFAYSTISAGLRGLDPAYEQVAASLGAHPARVLATVTVPLVLPSTVAAAGLCFGLSMGELGATSMVYPANWATLPVTIFTLADRGNYFPAAALAVILLAVTFVVLWLMTRVRSRAAFR